MSKPVEFLCCYCFFVFLDKLMTITGKRNLSGLRKCSREWQLRSLCYTLEAEKEAQEGHMKSIGGRLGRREKQRGEISGIG